MNKKLVIVLIISTLLIGLAIIYLKFAPTSGSCGGFVGDACPDGYYCKGSTKYNEGAGTCVKYNFLK